MIQLVIKGALVVWALAGLAYAILAPASAYVVEGKWPKPAWVAICAVSALLFALQGIGFLSILGMVAVGVFFADVKPAVGGRRR